jgi:hypothetical protein
MSHVIKKVAPKPMSTGHKVAAVCWMMTTVALLLLLFTHHPSTMDEDVWNLVAAGQAGVCPRALSPVGGDSAAPESIESRFNSQMHLHG